MDIHTWATQLVFGDHLTDKLVIPESPTDDVSFAPVLAPTFPGRPATLRPQGARAPFPTEREITQDEARARLLHFFANHELLAIELFAFALLRFPDAPRAFRRGLVGIIVEEQRHLAAYLARMEALGMTLGDQPVNGYLWSALSGADSPTGFLAGLSLTFEQANLDHAAWWATRLRRVGDEETARILDVVLADEIGHVAHGVRWLDRWRDPATARWDAWVAALPPTLTPARAKGPGFLRDARHAAGLDDDFIERLAVFGASKGRPPVVYLFHPGVEEELAGRPPSATHAVIEADLGALPLFLAGQDDVVVVRRRPSTRWLAQLAEAGFTLPELLVADSATDAARRLGDRRLGGLAPWARSPSVAAAFGEVSGWDEAWRALYTKVYSVGKLREWRAGLGVADDLCPIEDVGTVCLDERTVTTTLTALRARGVTEAVVKLPFGTAGRGMARVRLGPEGLPPTTQRFIRAGLTEQGALVVEPWLDKVVDLSLQFTVHPDGTVTTERLGRFLTDARGRYLGAVIGRPLDGLPPEVVRFFHGDGAARDRVLGRLRAVAAHLGRDMAARRYTGPAGIDAMVVRAPDGRLRLKPLVELNPRVTMGRVALALQRRIRGVGLWMQPTVRSLRAAGHADAAAWAEDLARRWPLVIDPGSGLIDRGVLFTTDPTQARMVASVLLVGDTLAGLPRAA